MKGRLRGGMPFWGVDDHLSDLDCRAVDLILGNRITDSQFKVRKSWISFQDFELLYLRNK